MGNINVSVSNGFKWIVSTIFSLLLTFFSLLLTFKIIDLAYKEKPPEGIGLISIPLVPILLIMWFAIVSICISVFLQNKETSQPNTVHKPILVVELLIILISAALSFFISSFVIPYIFKSFGGLAQLIGGPGPGPLNISEVLAGLIILIIFYSLPFLLIRKILSRLIQFIRGQ